MMRPRRLAHRGTVVATGFVIDASLVGIAESKRRVLACWTPGARVRQHRGQFVVTGLRACRVRTSAAPGTPLVEQHGLFAAMPLDSDEARELASPRAVVIARGGTAEVLPLDGVHDIDLASWIDLDEFEAVESKPLAAAPVRAAIPAPPSTDLRSLTGAPPADADVGDVTAALTRARGEGAAGAGTLSTWRRFVQWLSERIAPRPKALPPGGGQQAIRVSALGRLRNRIAEALWTSRLGMVLGRRHAAYLRNVLELFDRGELEEALRRAVPLGGGGAEARLSLAVPRPRQSLSLTFGARRFSSVVPVADLAITMMRDRYRAAAARLEQNGRIDEAAFVVAELLGEVHAAIALLERHGSYAVAARLAEARHVEPGLVVRLWFLAGAHQRAIDTARKHHAWADAVTRLERAGDKRAAVLRMLWADHLADTGDFIGAVEAAWSVKPSHALIETWIDRGIAAEGSAAARHLVKKLLVSPASFPEVAPALSRILSASDHEGARQRAAMIEELVASPATPELQTIARPALRALIRDAGLGAGDRSRDLVERLTKFAADPALRADRPAIAAAPRASTLLDRASPLELRWSAHDAGVIPVYDAAVLPGERLLLALGELGVRIVGRSGRTLAHLEQPATRLVVSDHGTRALAIASRGEVQRVARLDLLERRGAYWCDTELDDGASTFDGDLWIVTRGREVLAVDTTATRWRAVWGIEIDPVTAHCSIRRDGSWFVVSARDGEDLEHWYYQGFTLRARKPWRRSGTEYVVARPVMKATEAFVLRDREGAEVSDVAQIAASEVAGDLAVVSRRTGTGLTLGAEHLEARRTLANLVLDGAGAASMRLSDKLLTVGDDRGRVLVFDLERGVLRRELRTA